MMIQDGDIEAKEAAVREVAKLLPLPESLAAITTIRADYALRQQVSISFILFSWLKRDSSEGHD
jgi:exocyst complex component 3